MLSYLIRSLKLAFHLAHSLPLRSSTIEYPGLLLLQPLLAAWRRILLLAQTHLPLIIIAQLIQGFRRLDLVMLPFLSAEYCVFGRWSFSLPNLGDPLLIICLPFVESTAAICDGQFVPCLCLDELDIVRAHATAPDKLLLLPIPFQLRCPGSAILRTPFVCGQVECRVGRLNREA